MTDLCGDGTVLYLDCGGGYTNLHTQSDKITQNYADTNEFKENW